MPSLAASPLSPGFRRFLLAALLIALGFAIPLIQVSRLALNSELYSHIVLLPFVSVYLVWLRRDELGRPGEPIARFWSVLPALGGIGFLISYLASRPSPTGQDELAMAMTALVLLLITAAMLCLGRNELRIMAFPVAFLIFLAPFPVALEAQLETALQHGSAWTAHGIFELSGTPVMRNETYFRLPGFSMQVAPECSGIHSTLALFLTSLVAAQLLLRSPWRRATLALVVIPVALLRNGVRVFTIGELCVRIGPEMIDSYIHRKGGPIFFMLSLVPFSLILFWLIRSERRLPPPSNPPS